MVEPLADEHWSTDDRALILKSIHRIEVELDRIQGRTDLEAILRKGGVERQPTTRKGYIYIGFAMLAFFVVGYLKIFG